MKKNNNRYTIQECVAIGAASDIEERVVRLTVDQALKIMKIIEEHAAWGLAAQWRRMMSDKLRHN